MSLSAFPEVTANKSDEAHFNNIQDAISDVLLPRNADGDPEDLAGELGTEDFPWLKMSVATGHLVSGFIVPFYDFAGTLSLPHGYMICNGDQITREAYNAQHRTGLDDETDYWETFVTSSPFENLYLPGGDGRFLMGTMDPTADGLTPIAEAGNPGSQVDFSHNHGGTVTTGGSTGPFWDAAGTFPWYFAPVAAHTHNVTIPTATIVRDVTPLSVDVYNLMRIVE